MKLTKENVDTILMALTRIEVLEERLLKKRGNADRDFLDKLLTAKAAVLKAD